MPDQQIEYAIALARAGRLPDAAVMLRHTLYDHPDDIMAWKWLAFSTTDPHEALTAVRQVARLDPHDRWAREAYPMFERAARDAMIRYPAHGGTRAEGCMPVVMLSLVLLSGVLLILVAGRRLDTTAVQSLMAGTSGAPLEVPADVQVNSDQTYYSFEAGNLQEVQQALYTQGPEVEGAGQHSIALTNYEMWVTWEMTQSVTGCRMDNVIVHLDIMYTYPEWVPVGSPPNELVGEWNRFMDHVTAHEEHHGTIARQCAADLAMLLDSFDPGAVCTEAQTDLDKLVNDLYESCEIKQQAYDAAEGRTTFPLPAP